MTYADKLRDPRWQKKRLEIFDRDGFACQGCRSKTKTLNVHHLYYIPKRDPWDYPFWALKTLCDDCHEIVGRYRPGSRSEWEIAVGSMLGAFGSDRLLDFCQLIQDAAENAKESPELIVLYLFSKLRELAGYEKITQAEKSNGVAA